MENLLGDFLKKFRTENGLSLREFGKLADISHTHIDSIERGIDPRTGKTVKITNETLAKLAKATNTDATELFKLSIGKVNRIETHDITDSEVFTRAAHKVGHDGPLTDEEQEKIALAIKIALARNNKH